MSQITLTPIKGEKFTKGVAFAKKIGCRFDAGRKVWVRSAEALWDFVDGCRGDLTREVYLRRNGLEMVTSSAGKSPATTWMGQASMDHEDSIF